MLSGLERLVHDDVLQKSQQSAAENERGENGGNIIKRKAIITLPRRVSRVLLAWFFDRAITKRIFGDVCLSCASCSLALSMSAWLKAAAAAAMMRGGKGEREGKGEQRTIGPTATRTSAEGTRVEQWDTATTVSASNRIERTSSGPLRAWGLTIRRVPKSYERPVLLCRALGGHVVFTVALCIPHHLMLLMACCLCASIVSILQRLGRNRRALRLV